MAIATLEQGAGQAFTNLQALWIAGTLKARLIAFCGALITTPNLFPEEQRQLNPISNWCSVIQSISNEMVLTAAPVAGHGVTYLQLGAAANALFRMMWMSRALQLATTITTAQANAIIASYNAHLF